MVQKRSRSWRRVKVRTPSGAVAIRYRKPKPNPPRCAKCGAELHGIPRVRPPELHRIAYSEKTVNRPYGGNLCPNCLETAIKEKVRLVVLSEGMRTDLRRRSRKARKKARRKRQRKKEEAAEKEAEETSPSNASKA